MKVTYNKKNLAILICRLKIIYIKNCDCMDTVTRAY